MSRNDYDAHAALRASRTDTGARAPAPRVIRWHAGHAAIAAAVIVAAVIASQHVDALVAIARGFL